MSRTGFQFGKRDNKSLDDVKLYYSMDETTGDKIYSSSNRLPGESFEKTPSGNVFFDEQGKKNTGLKFPGSGRMQKSHSDHFSFADVNNDKPFSISFWIYFAVIATDNRVIFEKVTVVGGTYLEWLIFFHGASQRVTFQLVGDTTAKYKRVFDEGEPLIQNTWYHYAFTYDGVRNTTDGMKIYRDGVEMPNSPEFVNYTGMVKYTQAPISIGRRNDNTLALNGRLDELIIDDKEWNSNKVKGIKKATS